MSTNEQPTTQLCTFTVDDMLFGVEVVHVQEVIRDQPMTAVPLAPEVVRGLINLRGQIVTALDLRHRLGLPERPGSMPPMNVVVRVQGTVVSLLVDEIGDVVDVNQAEFESPPDNIEVASRDLIEGVYKLPKKLLLVLDTKRATEIPELV